MSSMQADPQVIKAEIRDSWNAISAGWEAMHDRFECGGAAMTNQLLELGGVRAGQRVLDVATGLGEPLATAARAVGPSGHVVGLDIAAEMIEVARRRTAGLDNVEFLVGDLETVDLPAASFDVVLSRWGLMFATDHVAAFRRLGRLLVPGGVLAASVWSEPGRTPMMSAGYAVMAQRLGLPPARPQMPGPFSMSDPDRLTAELTEAGFTEVSVTEFVVPFQLGSVREYVEFNQAVSPPKLLALVRDRLGAQRAAELWAAVGAAVERYRAGDGTLSLPSVALCVRATAAPAGA
jgi:ubiquinone/menaquinone biosynthesis C-methylase UbiE